MSAEGRVAGNTMVYGLEGRVLVGHDYDKTIALTSEPIEGGHTVESAYEIAVERVLGASALEEYTDTGGLHNRAPSQIVDQLAHHRPGMDAIAIRQKCEDLVAAKLDCLRPQLGRRLPDAGLWPRLNDGFAGYWQAVSAHPAVGTGVASSGHEEFVLKTFEIHNQPAPDVLVTDDDMRPAMAVLPRVLLEKPSRLLLDTLTHRWLEKLGLVAADDVSLADLQAIVAERVIFAGDDLNKDGRTALNAGVPFVHIPPHAPQPAFDRLRKLVLSRVSTEVSSAAGQ